MDDDNNPRPAQPKPRILQMSVPRPVVPEVSLMFDSDDSFIWQPQKPRVKTINNKNGNGNFTTRFHHSNIQPINEEITDEGISKDFTRKNPIEVENKYLSAQKGIDTRKPSWNTHAHLQHPSVNSDILQNTDMLRNTNETLKNNVETQDDIERGNSYPGSLGSSYVPPGRNHSSKYNEKGVPVTLHHGPVPVDTRIKQNNQIAGDRIRPMNVGNKIRPSLQSNSPVLAASTQVIDKSKIPFSVAYNPKMYDSSFSENVMNQNSYHPQKKNVQFHERNSPLHTENDNSRNMLEKENVPPEFVSNEPPLKNKYSERNNEGHGYQCNNFSESPINRNTSVMPTQYGSPDPFFYQMMQNQNQQILNLSNALDKLLDKEPKDKTDRPENIKRVKEIGIQTEETKKQCVTVGVNTDIVWSDLLESVKQKYQHERTRKTSCSGSTPKAQERNIKVNPESSKDQNYEKKIFSDRKSQPGGNHREVSLTLREIVMTTIQDDPPSPEPSLHLEIQEYPETIYNNNNNNHHGKWSDSPVLGESASMYERNSPPNSANRRQNGNPVAADRFQTPPSRNSDRYNEQFRNHRRESNSRDVDEDREDRISQKENEDRISQKENMIPKDSNNKAGMTYYNNVMMNVQQILQSSRSEEESKDRGQRNQVMEQDSDPQIAAVKQQLLHFGISFIDPATLTSKQNRGILDSLYLPGLQHMGLSVYQSEAVTTSLQPVDATAAKYLTDSQLAAIAHMSPAMSGHKKKQVERNKDTQAGSPSLNYNADTKARNPNNFSIATHNFLGKYGLRDET